MSRDLFYSAVLERSTAKDSLVHGPAHWLAVAKNGEQLALPETDPLVVFLFAICHDAMRSHDGDDPEHGKRGAELARRLFAPVLSEIQIEQLVRACTEHTDGKTTDDPTIGVCWDADRLDLRRVGILPDSSLLSLPSLGSTKLGSFLEEINKRTWVELFTAPPEVSTTYALENWPIYAARYGLKVDRYAALATEQLRAMLEGVRVHIRAKAFAVPDIYREGRFRHHFERKRTPDLSREQWDAYREQRRLWEQHRLGIPLTSNDRPIYGYLQVGDRWNEDVLSRYGNTVFVLKPEVLNRTTFCFDSLLGLPTPIKAPELVSTLPYDVLSPDPLEWPPEAQVHGGVTLSDVEDSYEAD